MKLVNKVNLINQLIDLFSEENKEPKSINLLYVKEFLNDFYLEYKTQNNYKKWQHKNIISFKEYLEILYLPDVDTILNEALEDIKEIL